MLKSLQASSAMCHMRKLNMMYLYVCFTLSFSSCSCQCVAAKSRFTHMSVHRVTAVEGHQLNTPNLNCVHLCALHSTQISASHQHLFHQHLVADTRGQLPISASDGWAGDAGGGVMNFTREAPLGLLSTGHFLKHLPPGYPSSEGMTVSAVRSLADRRTPDNTFWGFHHRFLSLHDQSDSRTGWCALTRTVVSACNKSVISCDDKRTCWWISVQMPRVACTTRFIWSVWSMEVVSGKQMPQ